MITIEYYQFGYKYTEDISMEECRQMILKSIPNMTKKKVNKMTDSELIYYVKELMP